MSKEHVWPDWLANYVPRESTHTIHRVSKNLGNQGLPSAVSTKPGKLNRPGDPKSQRLRMVCEDCNGGWMSRLQNSSKPLLIPLLHGEWPLLDQKAQKQIAAWVTMFVMVVEFADPITVGISQAERDELRRTSAPLRGWRVYIAPYKGLRNGSFWHRALLLIQPPNEPVVVSPAEGQSTVFVVGSVAFYAVSCFRPNTNVADFEISSWLPLTQIWPLRTRSISRPFRNFDDHDYLNVGGMITDILCSYD